MHFTTYYIIILYCINGLTSVFQTIQIHTKRMFLFRERNAKIEEGKKMFDNKQPSSRRNTKHQQNFLPVSFSSRERGLTR